MNLPVAFKVIGGTRYSTYNIPTESGCVGPSQTAFIFEFMTQAGTCRMNTGVLKSNFISQMILNGTGVSTSEGTLKQLTDTSMNRLCRVPPGLGATTSNTFVRLPKIAGKCGTELSNGVSLAVFPFPSPGGSWACADNVLQVNPNTAQNNSIRVVQDACFNCSGDFRGQNAHIDLFSSSPACGANVLPDSANFFSIRLR